MNTTIFIGDEFESTRTKEMGRRIRVIGFIKDNTSGTLIRKAVCTTVAKKLDGKYTWQRSYINVKRLNRREGWVKVKDGERQTFCRVSTGEIVSYDMQA